jgi:hypothetical protein
MTEQTPEELAPVGEGCLCVSTHAPRAYVPNKHHILPESWGGKKVPENLIPLCANAHTSVHYLIDQYVRAGGLPPWSERAKFSPFIRDLAARAWAQRPEKPTITSLHAAHY